MCSRIRAKVCTLYHCGVIDRCDNNKGRKCACARHHMLVSKTPYCGILDIPFIGGGVCDKVTRMLDERVANYVPYPTRFQPHGDTFSFIYSRTKPCLCKQVPVWNLVQVMASPNRNLQPTLQSKVRVAGFDHYGKTPKTR